MVLHAEYVSGAAVLDVMMDLERNCSLVFVRSVVKPDNEAHV